MLLSGFRRRKVEENIWWWTSRSLKVLVGRQGPSVQLPVGYEPRVKGSKVILDGPGLEALLQARKERDALLGRQESPLRKAEHASRTTTLEQAYTMMMENLEQKVGERTRRKATVRSYQSHWSAIRDVFGIRPLASIDPSELQIWLDQQRTRVKPRTRWHYRQTLGRIFSFAARRGMYAMRNPIDLTEPIELPVDDKGRQLTENEVLAILQACQDESRPGFWFTFFTVMALTGLRYKECSELRWEDIAFDQKLVVPTHQKARKRRDALVLSPELERVLADWAGKERVGLVFPGGRGNPVTYKAALTALKRIAKRAEVKDGQNLGLHSFRRMNATVTQSESRGDTMSFLTVVRHQDLDVSRRYTPKLPAQAVKLSLRTSRRLGKIIDLTRRLKSAA